MYRILSIDGGGLLGTLPASFLAAIEEQTKQPIGNFFDLIAGTSTGGIIAIGLGMGMRASEILDLYVEQGPIIFGQVYGRFGNWVRRRHRFARSLIRAKYNPAHLKAALTDILGDKKLCDSTRRLLIPAWNPTARDVYIYKTPHHERLRTDYRVLAVDVALATAAAPTYFPRHFSEHDVGLLDGGVWANNPIAIAVVEAISMMNWPGHELCVLSLGCLEETYSFPTSAGVGTLGVKVVKLLMDGQSKSALGIAKHLTRDGYGRHAVYRIDHTVASSKYTMDDARVIRELKGLGETLARQQYPILESVFFRTPAEPFVPLYTA
jgi:patatin-like phospholipase/acyl hydrolase